MKQNKALQWFFWLTFGAFLTPSIPHIAAIFRAWEPVEAINSPLDLFWWGVSYAVAISIDGTIIWLTHTVVIALQEKRIDRWYVGSLIAFVGFLTSVSWLVNWWYAENDAASAARLLPGAIHAQIFGLVDSASVMPIITSMFPILAIMFTVMANRVMGAREIAIEAPMSDVEFASQIKLANQKKALKEANKGKGFIAWVGDQGVEAKQAIAKVKGKSLTDNAEVNEDVIDEESESQEEVNAKSTNELSQSQETGQTQIDLEVMRLIKQYPAIGSWLSTGKKTATLDEIVIATTSRKSTVQNAVDNGQLKRSKNPDLIRVSSVVNWLKTKPLKSKSNGDKEPITDEHEAVRLDS